MGNQCAKSSLRDAIVHLSVSAEQVKLDNDKFWNQFWTEEEWSNELYITLQEVRILRDGSASNFSALIYKMVERFMLATKTLCNSHSQQTAVLNATKILTTVLPAVFEDKDWKEFFLKNSIDRSPNAKGTGKTLIFPEKKPEDRDYSAYIPSIGTACFLNDRKVSISSSSVTDNTSASSANSSLIDPKNVTTNNQPNLAVLKGTDSIRDDSLLKILVISLCDLLFCPEFTVSPHNDDTSFHVADGPPEDIRSLVSYNYIWEPGVGYESSINSTTNYDKSRSDLLRLLLTCFSSTLYIKPEEAMEHRNYWIEILASNDNRHALPLFTSLLNTVLSYKPNKILPFNSLLYEDSRKELAELAAQVLIATLDYKFPESNEEGNKKNQNLFIEYISRIHRDEDIDFIIQGFKSLLNDKIDKVYMLSYSQHIDFDQELMILFWKFCDLNPKFMRSLLNSKDLIEIIIPIVDRLNVNFQEPSKTAMTHTGVFILLMLSGERNFGIRLNKPYQVSVLTNLPPFNGTYTDLIIIVFHKLILYGHNVYQLFDYMLAIIANISPYIKALSMISSKCLIQLFEIFSAPFVIFTEPNYHQIVLYLFEIFNNIIQYQFDGNTNLICSILQKKDLFLNLKNLPTTDSSIRKVLNKLSKIRDSQESDQVKVGEDSNLNEEGNSVVESKMEKTNSPGSSRNEIINAIISSSCDTHERKSPRTIECIRSLEAVLTETPDVRACIELVYLASEQGTENKSDLRDEATVEEKPSLLLDTGQQSSEPAVDPFSCTNELVKLEEPNPAEDEVFEASSRELDTSIDQELDISTGQEQPDCWRPTAEFMKKWKDSLSMHTTVRMIEVLMPQIERLERVNRGCPSEEEIIEFLKSGTMVGLLPVPHPISIRKYNSNGCLDLWFKTCTWATIYVRCRVWTGTKVELMKVTCSN